MAKKLYRSVKDRKLAGVCGGIGEYLDVDPVLIRIVWLVLVLAAGTGLVGYVVAWIIVPEAPPESLV